MRDVLRIAIVDPSEATREPLRNLLMGVESVWLESECARYEFFFDVIHQSELDVSVISLDADHAKAIQLISQVTEQHPTLPIFAPPCAPANCPPRRENECATCCSITWPSHCAAPCCHPATAPTPC